MSALEIEVLEASEAACAEPRRPALPTRIDGVLIGTLLGFKDDGRTPLVVYREAAAGAAMAAAAIVDLHGAHIGRRVVLQFEAGDPLRPIVMGVLRQDESWPLAEQPAQVQVDADGERMIVSAKERLVLRCGKASITLTKAGKVLIHGEYVVSRSNGMNRIKGGSVQIN